MSPKKELYQFTRDFETQVAYLTCTSKSFFGRIGHALDPDSFAQEAAQMAVRAAQQIATDLGHGPGDSVLVLQRVRRWMDDGKLKNAQLISVSDLLDAAEDAGVMQEEAAVTEVTPILKHRVRATIVEKAMSEYSARGDFSNVVDLVDYQHRLGVQDVSLGTRVGPAAFATIDSFRHLDRLPTGIMELDAALSNGMPRGQLGMFIGGPGDGKSMQLSHIAGTSWRAGLSVGYATLELPEHIVLARLMANVTGLPIDPILDGDKAAERLIERMELGQCVLKSFTPQATTPDDIHDWAKMVEDASGRKMDVLVVDYADKLTARLKGKKRDDGNVYTTMELVYEGLRLHAEKNKSWAWTASQQGRKKKDQGKNRVADLDDVADSMGKVRVADLVITLNGREESTQMEWFIAKNRTGKSRIKVGPLPVDFAAASMVMRASPADGQASMGDTW